MGEKRKKKKKEDVGEVTKVCALLKSDESNV
jgi:hypothetical protein